MGTRIHEGWGGNRVYDGTDWMELYYALELELTGGAGVQLTGNGKIPNGNSSVLGRMLVNAVFDANTLDNSNTFTLGGGVWPSFSGSVSIPTVSEKQIYNHTALLWPDFGSSKSFRVTASLTGIDRVPGTTSFDKNLPIPARAWAKPDVPTVIGAQVIGSTAYLDVSGHQNNPAADKYWQTQDKTIYDYAAGQWTETHGLAGNSTTHSWSVVENNSYLLGVRTWNEDGGVSAWSPWVRIYTKPATPTGLTVTRPLADRTKVVLNWTNNAPYASIFYIFRWNGSSWVQIGTSTTETYTDTRTMSDTSYYCVMVGTPTSVYSDQSASVAAPLGYAAPDAPTNVQASLLDSDTARVSFGGSVTNPASEKYWMGMQLDLNKNDTFYSVDHTEVTGELTFMDSTTVLDLDSKYNFRARAYNEAADGAWGYAAGPVYTLPAAPTAVTVARNGISEEVNGSFTNNARWPESHKVYRRIDGGAETLVATLPAGTTTFTDSVPMPATATYTVETWTPTPSVASARSAVSNTIPFVGYDKDGIPGVDDIFVGTDKVYKVMAGTNQIWLG